MDVISHPRLTELESVRHGFFTRDGGVSTGLYASLNCGLGSRDVPEAVRENRRRAAAHLGLSAEHLCTAHQVHSAKVCVVETPWKEGEAPQVDALVSRMPEIALGVLTADCAPILLADASAGVIGAVHAGWRGALDGVLEAGVEAMVDLGAHRSRIVAALGPSIRQESYEVGPEFPAPFLARDARDKHFFHPAAREGHYLFDLPGYVMRRLRALELCDVEATGHDTRANEARFFSYRRNSLNGQRDYGRGLSAIALAG